MKNMKKALASLLILVLVVTNIPLQNVMATDATQEVSESVVEEDVAVAQTESSEVAVTSLTCNHVEIVEGTNGYYSTGYDSESGEYKEYYRYSIYPTYTVAFSDGTVLENQRYNVTHNGKYYPMEITSDQSYENQWGIGTYTVTATMDGVTSTFTVDIIENPIESIACDSIEIIEETNGWYMTDTENQEYFSYNVNPVFTITFKDGTVLENQRNGITYNGEYYPLYRNDNQSINHWSAGNTYNVTVTLMEVETTVEVSIVESPIQSITCKPVEIIEKTGGMYLTEYDSETGENIEYYHYDVYPVFTVTFKDGTVLENQRYGITYNGEHYSLNMRRDQSYKNQWGIGTYTVSGTLMGVTTSCTVNIIETPIQSITCKPLKIIKGTNGSVQSEYDWETGTYNDYYRYNTNTDTTIVFKDGTIIENQTSFYYKDQYYYIEFNDGQSYKNQWDVGTHTVTGKVLGVETTYDVSIIESPYVSIEVLNVAPVVENEDCYMQGTNAIYDIPDFSYRVTHEDGTKFVGYYDAHGDWYGYNTNDASLNVSSDQEQNPWTVDGENYFTVSYAGAETKVKVDLQPSSPYEYYEENGEIFITECKKPTEVLEIPSEIDGLPVVAILGLGNVSSAVKELIIPDSVRTIAESGCGYLHQLEKVYIGSGVSYVSVDMFWGWQLKEITVSDDNAYYSSKDGVVYDKEGTTIIVYPRGKGTEFTVPKEVTNADVMFSNYSDITLEFEEGSTAYVKEDGVLYGNNKTKIISCDVDKSGEYVMPDSVTEILDCAFMDCTELTSVVVSKNVTSIAYLAFMNCTSLESVELPTGLSSIERRAFSSCASLDVIELPETLETIEKEAFEYSGVARISIPDSVTEMGECAFISSELSEVNIGTGLTTISYGAFQQTKLINVTLSDNVEIVESHAFSYTPLEKVIFGENVRVIESEAFYKTNLKELEIPNNVTDIGSSAFYETSITEVVIPDSVINMGYSVFANCSELTDVTVGVGISHVPFGSFSGCKSLDKVVFKNESVTIGQQAFEGCPLGEMEWDNIRGSIGLGAFKGSGLTSVTLPEGVTEVVYESFMNSTALAYIDVPESLVHVGGTAFDNTAWYNEQPEGMVYLEHILYKYKGTLPQNAELTVQDGTTVITDNIFENNKKLTKINLPEGLLTIGDDSFSGCSNLTEIEIPSTVEYIGDYAFEDSGLTEITIPASVKHIGEQILAGVNAANIYVDPNNEYYTSVDGVLFNKDCTKLLLCPKRTEASYTVPKTVQYIAPHAFDNSGVAELIVKNYYTELGEDAFGYEEIAEPTSNGQYLDCKIVCYENSLADVYARKNLIPVEIAEPDVVEMSIQSIPAKTEYERGEKLDTTGLSLAITLSDGSTGVVSEGYEVSEFDSSTVGTKTITVTYKEFTAEFSVYVKEPTLTGIAIQTAPKKQEYERNEKLDTTGIVIAASYSDGSTESVESGFEVSEFDSSTVGTKTITVTYEGFTAEFSVYVKEPTLTGIAIQTVPKKQEYERNETLDTTGLVIEASYSDGSTASVTSGFEVSGFDSSTVGAKTITVTYEGFETEFSVRVKEPTVTGIAIENNPSKLIYDIGQSIDTTGLSLLATYSDGSTQSITSGFELDKYDLNATGEKSISIMYEGYTTSFEVIVKQAGKVIVGNAKGRPGQEVEVTLSFEQAMSVKSLGINDLVYDTSKLQLISGTWNAEGMISDWNMEKQEGVLTFSKETEIEQFLTLTFLILEGTEDGDVTVECKVIATEQFENKVESNIGLTYEYGKVTVYNVLPGDADGNDIINSDDAVYLLYHTLMADRYPINQDCDFNGDGMVNSDDAIYLLYHVMMPDRYPLE